MTITTRRGPCPSTDGSVTLPETIDFHRKHNPEATVYVFHEDGSPEVTKITHLEFGRACDRVAHYLRPGRQGPERQVVAFIAQSDSLLYQTVVMGIMRAGLVPYPMSPRNTAAATIKLLKDTSCHRLITTRETLKPLVDELRAKLASDDPAFELSIEEVPPLSIIYPRLGRETSEDPFRIYPTEARPSLDDTMIYLHSSGSTGFPKSIRHSFQAMLHWSSFPVVSDLRDHANHQTMACHALPCFHTLGFVAQLHIPLYGLVIVSLYPPIATTPTSIPVLPSPHNIIDHTRRTKSTCLVIIPALLQLWSHDPATVEFLASLQFVSFAGGSLPSKIGDRLTKAGVVLAVVYGATEFGTPCHYFKDPGEENDWEYIKFSSQPKIRWDPQGDGTYEAHFLTCENHQVSVENLEDIRGYATSDLCLPHPTNPLLWKVIGRKDDVIIHSSGEKTVPAPMEDILMSSPYFLGVVMFGRERDQAGVLVELKPNYAIDVNDEQQVIKARNLIWPIVDEANKVAPAFSRIFKELILFVAKDKPLPRAGKGTVMRKAALTAYNAEIDDIYAKVEATVKVDSVVPPTLWTLKAVQEWLLSQITDIQSTKSSLSATDDLFEHGFDSLSATILRRRIVGALQATASISSSSKEEDESEKRRLYRIQSSAQVVTQTTIYDNPTILKLAEFLVGIISDPDHAAITTSRTEAIEKMIAKYSAGLDGNLPNGVPANEAQNGVVVLITGTTGNLGAQLLEALLRNENVRKVYTLNRPSGGKDVKVRHEERFLDKGLERQLLDDERVVYLEGELKGLKDEVYQQLLKEVNLIIHNAWRLDFNLSLSSFEPNLKGARDLIDFARSSQHASSLKFLFTSSISSANSWDQSKGRYPEEVVLDPKYAIGTGYGESKYVTERILAQSGLQATSFRIGQISGGLPNGAWATTDWVPILVKTSLSLGALPSVGGVVSWLPMHSVAKSLLDVGLVSGKQTSSPALNVVHPSPVAWDEVFEGVNAALVKEGVTKEKLPIVEFTKWYELLEAKAQSDADLKNFPGIKLLSFFRHINQVDKDVRSKGLDHKGVEAGGFPGFATQKVQSISDTMKHLPSLGSQDSSLWVRYWKTVGLL